MIPMNERRTVLKYTAGAITALLASRAVHSHTDFGAVNPPVSVPDIVVRGHNNRVTSLSSLLLGNVTAVQLMFTGCSAVCPMSGFLFNQVQQRVAAHTGNRIGLLSLSISPLEDDPGRLTQWLAKYDASALWQAASPHVDHLERMTSMFQLTGDDSDPHTGSVYLFNERAELVWRTLELPSAKSVVARIFGTANKR